MYLWKLLLGFRSSMGRCFFPVANGFLGLLDRQPNPCWGELPDRRPDIRLRKEMDHAKSKCKSSTRVSVVGRIAVYGDRVVRLRGGRRGFQSRAACGSLE